MARLDRGGKTEELLREYFLRAGYFVIRGAKINYREETVTDVDLWLYLKGSSLSRERTNVDAKDRDRPRALERVLWAVGVRELLGVDRVIVATTDKRPDVRAYAAMHGVDVLDGYFLRRLSEKGAASELRLVEEEFLELVHPKEEKFLVDWKRRIESAKSRMLSQLSFDECNLLLDDARLFLDACITSHRRESAARALYLTVAFFLIALDYSTRSLGFIDVDSRREVLVDGFRFGSGGKTRATETIELATRIAATYGSSASGLREHVSRDLLGLPVEILADHFGKAEVLKDLFELARKFESCAYGRSFAGVGTLEPAMQAVLGVLMDFFQIEREDIYGRF